MSKILNKEIPVTGFEGKEYIDFEWYDYEDEGNYTWKVDSIKIEELYSFKDKKGLKHDGLAKMKISWDLNYKKTEFYDNDDEFSTEGNIKGHALCDVSFSIDEGGIWNQNTEFAKVSVDLKTWKTEERKPKMIKSIIENMQGEVEWIAEDQIVPVLESLNLDWDKIKESKNREIELLVLKENNRKKQLSEFMKAL